MNRWRVGEDRGSKETDGCPLTLPASLLSPKYKSQTSEKLIPNASPTATDNSWEPDGGLDKVSMGMMLI
jgi:hypothetical protein